MKTPWFKDKEQQAKEQQMIDLLEMKKPLSIIYFPDPAKSGNVFVDQNKRAWRYDGLAWIRAAVP